MDKNLSLFAPHCFQHSWNETLFDILVGLVKVRVCLVFAHIQVHIHTFYMFHIHVHSF